MHITFGLHLDAGVWPHPLHNTPAIAGTATVGPLKLLTILETHLGHLAPPTSPSLRVAAFYKSLQEQDNDQRFYHASFARDPWGVAAHLLTWHDQLTEAGWNHTPLATAGRLHDLTSLPAPPYPSLAQRIWTAAHQLPERQTFIERITLADPIEDFPRPWQALLTRLNVPIEPLAPIEPPGSPSDLHRLLHVETPTGDGSAIHLRGGSPWETAEQLAAWLAQKKADLGTIVVICEGHGDTLDKAFQRYDLPALGSHQASAWRPATQVLPLLLSLAWKPLDPYRLLEYLSLPRSPLPLGRSELAKALMKSPGIGGDVWQQALESAAHHARPYVSTDGLDVATAAALLQEAQDKDREKLSLWLGGLVPLAHFDRTEGIPVRLVQDAASRVAQWASTPDDPVLRTARSHAAALKDALSLWSGTTIPATHMEQLLSQITAHGTERSTCPAELGRFYVVHSPAAILAPADTIVWWHFVDTEPVPRLWPWTAAELETLKAADVLLNPLADNLRARARTWKRPLLAARQRLILASWERDGVDTVKCHPLHDQFQDPRRIEVSPYQAVNHGSHPLLGPVPTVALPLRSGPTARPLWQVAPGLVRPRDKESPSSIETLLHCPLKWTLHYSARLAPRPLMGLPDHTQLFGLLAHRILEEVVTRDPFPTPLKASVHAQGLFEAYLPEMAAALLQPSRAMERRELQAIMGRAAESLVEHLQASPYRVVAVEVPRQGTFGPSELEGRIDILLEDRDTGAPAVLDIKWSSHYYRKKLQNGSAIQLAIYSHLVQRPEDVLPPAVAYYSVRDQRLLVPEGSRFQDRAPIYGPSVVATLQSTRTAHAQRFATVAAGTIAATGHDDIKDDKLKDGELKLKPPCGFCDYGHFCGVGEVAR